MLSQNPSVTKLKVYLQPNLNGTKQDTTIFLQLTFANKLQVEYLQDEIKKVNSVPHLLSLHYNITGLGSGCTNWYMPVREVGTSSLTLAAAGGRVAMKLITAISSGSVLNGL